MKISSELIVRTAGLSRCGTYRYWLKRVWDKNLPECVFVCLNPSTADAGVDDPTLRRIVSFADSWGYGAVTVANLFAFRATDPKLLKRCNDPIGPRNNYWLRRLCSDAELTVAAWGNGGKLYDRDAWLRANISGLHCLGTTSLGQPKHPLYVAKKQTLMAFPARLDN